MPKVPDSFKRRTTTKAKMSTEVEVVIGKGKNSKSKGRSKSGYVVQRNYDPMKLTAQQRRFVFEYCVDCKGADAARRAGYSDKSAAETAGKLLNHPVVKAAIAKRQMFLAKDFTITSRDVLRQLIYALTRDAIDFCDKETGHMITDIRRLPARARACIDGVEQEVTVLHDSKGQPIGQRIKTKLKLVSKAKAIEMAMQHKGLFKPTNSSSQKVDVDWDAIADDNRTNPIDEIIADPLKYLNSKARAIEARVVEPSKFDSGED